MMHQASTEVRTPALFIAIPRCASGVVRRRDLEGSVHVGILVEGPNTEGD